MILIVPFLIGVVSYLLAVWLATMAYRTEQPQMRFLGVLPGIFGWIMMGGCVLSTANEAGLFKNVPLPEALMGFLFFVSALVFGVPVPWLLGWGLARLLSKVSPPPKRSRRRRVAED